MRTLFTRFEIRSEDSDRSSDEVIDEVAETCWKWVTDSDWVDKERIPQRWEEGEFNQNETDSLMVSDDSCEGARFWRMDRSEWGRERKGLKYDHYIFVVTNGENVEFSILQDIVHQTQRIGPHEEDILPPFVIRDLVSKFECSMDGEAISGSWDSISPTETRDFVEGVILNPSRNLPIVLLSKRWETGKSVIGGIGRLSRRLAGLAHVNILSAKNSSHDEFFGEQRTSNGSIRIFWPGLTREGMLSKARENLYSPKKFESDFDSDESLLIQEIVNRICQATSTLQASRGLVDEVRSKIEQEAFAKEKEESDRARKEVLSQLKTSQQKLAYLETENEDLRGDVALLRIEVSNSKEENAHRDRKILSLNRQIQILSDQNTDLKKFERAVEEGISRDRDAGIRGLIDHLEGYGREEEAPSEEDETIFLSVGEAFEKARERFSSRIRFLDSALDSARRVPVESDAKPSKVYEIFEKLYEDIWPKLKEASEGHRLVGSNRFNTKKELIDCFGDMYAESDSGLTRDMYRKQYDKNGRMFEFSPGVRIRIIPHIKMGSRNKLRIHLLCLHANSSYEAHEMVDRDDGKIQWKRKKEVIRAFPQIIVGWCGKHLPNARLNG